MQAIATYVGYASVSNRDGVLYWGLGSTADEAEKNWKASGGRKRDRRALYEFRSKLPFAPRDRDATEEESDFWIGDDWMIYTVRCEYELISKNY